MSAPQTSLHSHYRAAYALAVQLNENGDALAREARLCVMEAFNELADSTLGPPTFLPAASTRTLDQTLSDLQTQLSGLLAGAPSLEEALRFTRCRDLIRAATLAQG